MAEKGIPLRAEPRQLIEREQVVAATGRVLDASRTGSRRGLIILGEEGMGKSALLAHACTAATTSSLEVLVLKPYSPHPSSRQALLSTSWSIGGTAGVRIEDAAALISALEGDPRRIVLLVDDFEKLDLQMCQAVNHFFMNAANCGGLVLATASASAVYPEPITPVPIPSSVAWVEYHTLTGLSADGLAELAATVLRKPCLPHLVAKLRDLTGGNPLFARELLTFWEQEGLVREVGDYLELTPGSASLTPASLGTLADRRLSATTGTELHCLRVLALLGRPAGIDELTSIIDDFDPELLLGLTERQFIVEESSSHERSYRLSHPLLEGRIIASLNSARRGHIHGLVSDGLQRSQGHSSPQTRIELALHAAQALRPPANLADLVADGAQAAMAEGSAEVAADLAHRWLSLTSNASDRHTAMSLLGEALNSVDPSRAVDAFTEALNSVEDPSLKVRMHLGRAQANRRLGRLSAAHEDFRNAARISPDTSSKFDARHGIASLLGMQRHYDDARTLLEDLRHTAPDDNRKARALGHLAQVNYSAGEVMEALALATEAQQLTTDPSYGLYLQSNRGWYQIILGSWREASELLGTAASTASQNSDLWNLVNILADLSRLQAWTGDLMSATETARRAMQLATDMGNPADILHARTVWSEVLAEQGAWDSALAMLEAISLDKLPSMEPRDVPVTLSLYAEALFRCGDARRAGELLEEAELWLIDGPHLAVGVVRTRAALALGTGSASVARDLCERGLAMDFDYALERARLSEIAAEASRLCRRKRDAETHAREALARYRTLGADGSAGRVEAWLSQHPASPKGRARSKLVHGLTEREVEVLWLVTRGQTSKEIGRSLFISEGTVRKHIENIKLKAGVNRRTELVTFAGTIGISPQTPPNLSELQRD